FIHVADAADCLAALALDRTAPSVVNIGSGESSRLTDVIGLVQNITGRALEVARRPARRFDVPLVELAVDTLRSLTNLSPRPLHEGIAETWREQYVPLLGDQRASGIGAG
ncbi:MAG: hypothetical protein WCI22_04725, partial [Actinomycetota bacterium]